LGRQLHPGRQVLDVVHDPGRKHDRRSQQNTDQFVSERLGGQHHDIESDKNPHSSQTRNRPVMHLAGIGLVDRSDPESDFFHHGHN
jgi:hypothetical protein